MRLFLLKVQRAAECYENWKVSTCNGDKEENASLHDIKETYRLCKIKMKCGIVAILNNHQFLERV